jgi:ferredoxin like protein
MSIDEKLLKTRFIIDSGNPHITLDAERCGECPDEPCLIVCPTQCYKKEKEKLLFSWENCIECGSCRIVCPLGSITWNYPRGGFGVCYRYG